LRPHLDTTRVSKETATIQSATMPATTAETLSLVNRSVTVAPMVLLSAVDHYNRTIVKGSKRRVVGVLLGQNDGKNVRVSNSFAGEFSPLSLSPLSHLHPPSRHVPHLSPRFLLIMSIPNPLQSP